MRTVIAASILFVTSAADASTARHAAAPPGPHPGAVKGGGWLAHSELHREDDRHATYELVFATRSEQMRELTVPIAIPTGQVITGMTIAGYSSLVGVATSAVDARSYYDNAVQAIKDPALVEWKDAHHVLLHVFPVTRDEQAKVTITLVAADTIEGHAAHLDATTSWVASPYTPGPAQERRIDPNDPYADYWPEHH